MLACRAAPTDAIEAPDMDKQIKLEAVMLAAGDSEDVARQYLDAEEWIVCEAIFDIRAERYAGLLWRAPE